MSTLMDETLNERGLKVNDILIKGLGGYYLKDAPRYLDSIFKAGMRGVKNTNFKYMGWRYLTPMEDYYNQFTSSNRDSVDIAKSTLYKIEFLFDLNGEPIKRILALPYTEDGSILYLSDSPYNVSTVLSEYVISSNGIEVFARLLKDKLIFKNIEKNILINGVKTPAQLTITKLYKFKNTNVNDKIPVALMLFVKNGFYGTYKKYFNTKPLIYMDVDIDLNKYKDDYVVFQSTGIKPRTLHDNNYRPHNITIIIEKDKVNEFTINVTNSLISVFDLINIYSKNIIKAITDENKERMFFKVLLGKVIFKNSYTVDKLLTTINEYLDVVEGYIDPIVEEKLAENGIHVTEFYELIAYVIKNYNDIVRNAESNSSKLSNRYMDTLYYMLYELIAGINKTLYGINKEAGRKELTVKSVNDIFNKQLSSRKIFSLIKSGSVALALTPVDYSGDNYFFKITSVLEDQNRGEGVKRSKNNVFPRNTRVIHGEDLYMGSLLYLSKKSPSPRFKVNPFMDVDIKTGKITPNGKMLKSINILNDLLTSKFTNQKILDSVIEEPFDGD